MKHCTIDDGFAVLHGEDGFEYDICLDRIKTEKDLIIWLVHISDKTWVHKEMLRDFIFQVCGEKGWKTHGV